MFGQNKRNKNVEILIGDPRKAILSLSVPLMVALLVTSLQSYIDSFWVSGLGSNSVSAINLAGPVYLMVAYVGIGMGVGTSTAVSRALGAKDGERAEGIASQSIGLGIVISLFGTVILLLAAEPILHIMGNGENVDLAMEYVVPLALCSWAMVGNGLVTGLLRGEGAARMSLYLSIAAAAVNVILDPILIYTLGLGVTGASIATCCSFAVTTTLGLWLYTSGRMFVTICFRGFRFDRDRLNDIFVVGIPHTLGLVLVPLMMMPENSLIVRVGGAAGLMLYTLPFTYNTLAGVPARGISGAMVSVASAAVGADDMDKVKASFRYSLETSLAISACLAVLMFVLSDPLAAVFTQSGDMVQYRGEISRVIRIFSGAVMFGAIYNSASSLLQALEFAAWSSTVAIGREFLFLGMFVLALTYGMELVYWSVVICNAAAAAVSVLLVWRAMRLSRRGMSTSDRGAVSQHRTCR